MESSQDDQNDGLEPFIYSEDMNYLLQDNNDIKIILEDPTLFQNSVVQPIEPTMIPSNEDYPGPYNFEMLLDRDITKNWVYSSKLRKIFITPNTNFLIDFKWIFSADDKLCVRAMPLFSLPENAHDVVQRCHNHAHYNESTNRDIPSHVRHHIIRCKHPNAVYEGGPDTRLSVVVPLGQPQSGVDTVRHTYEFVCQNSCPSGMNRRPIEVVFTLEDCSGRVYGRTRVNVRICSCPKRDKEKEEKEESRKNGTTDVKPPQGKKRKAANPDKKPISFNATATDTKVYEVKFNIVGKHNLRAILDYAHALTTREIYNHGIEESSRTCLNEISSAMKNLTEK